MLGRRGFIRLGLMAGLIGIAGCGRSSARPILRAAPEDLPKELLKTLPHPWQFKPLVAQSLLSPSQFIVKNEADLLAVGDGWLTEFPKDSLQSIKAEKLFSGLDTKAQKFLESFGPELSSKAFPIGISPWVMLFRNGKDWLYEAKQGWDVLLDPELTGQVVFPESARFVISLADRIEGADVLRRLRSQAHAFDDRNGLNWLLAGKARVAILPLYRCFRSLLKDPRLNIALPQAGAPLHWTFLVRPRTSRQSFPTSWLEEAWAMPQMAALLSRGWMSPLPSSNLIMASNVIPDSYKPILLPSDSFWNGCWSFSPLTNSEKARVENLWSESIP